MPRAWNGNTKPLSGHQYAFRQNQTSFQASPEPCHFIPEVRLIEETFYVSVIFFISMFGTFMDFYAF